jgi:hypothetical protein
MPCIKRCSLINSLISLPEIAKAWEVLSIREIKNN